MLESQKPESKSQGGTGTTTASSVAKVAPGQPDANGWMSVPSVVAGDVVRFRERVFRGKYPRRRSAGRRIVIARVLRESYGPKTQQHTFTIEVVSCEGNDPIAPGTVIRRMGRNLYRRVKRRLWDDETARLTVLEEKYARRELMREARRARSREARKRQRRREKEADRQKALKQAQARETNSVHRPRDDNRESGAISA